MLDEGLLLVVCVASLPRSQSPQTCSLRSLSLTPRSDQRHIGTLAGKLNELNKKVADIQREQRYMREVEEQFRDLSEATNSRAVWYCIAQIVVLVAAGVWQMRHLKVYFEDKKLR